VLHGYANLRREKELNKFLKNLKISTEHFGADSKNNKNLKFNTDSYNALLRMYLKTKKHDLFEETYNKLLDNGNPNNPNDPGHRNCIHTYDYPNNPDMVLYIYIYMN